MNSVRDQTLEEAAKICESIAASNEATLKRIAPDDDIDVAGITLSGAVSSARLCAAAIRAKLDRTL